MKNNNLIINILVYFILIVLIWTGCFYIPKINYINYSIKTHLSKWNRDSQKNIKLQKNIVFFVNNYSFRENVDLSLYKDYFTINWDYCDISNDFFVWINQELSEKNIIFKPKLSVINSDFSQIEYKTLWKQIKLENLKTNICKFIKSENNLDYIEIELENYKYWEKQISELKNYELIWSYKINKYLKTPLESITNSQNLIDKISNELILPNENISLLEKLLSNWWTDLLKSNILKNGEIIKWIWGGSCLASSIIYRTLLNAWIEIKSQKTHNIYYQNIYWVWEIWLDSTIYEDEKYFVDLIFKNNYKNSIIFIPNFTDEYIELNVYWKEKEYTTKLTPIELLDVNNISWKYEIFDKNNVKMKENILKSKYDKIDNF